MTPRSPATCSFWNGPLPHFSSSNLNNLTQWRFRNSGGSVFLAPKMRSKQVAGFSTHRIWRWSRPSALWTFQDVRFPSSQWSQAIYRRYPPRAVKQQERRATALAAPAAPAAPAGHATPAAPSRPRDPLREQHRALAQLLAVAVQRIDQKLDLYQWGYQGHGRMNEDKMVRYAILVKNIVTLDQSLGFRVMIWYDMSYIYNISNQPLTKLTNWNWWLLVDPWILYDIMINYDVIISHIQACKNLIGGLRCCVFFMAQNGIF